MSHSPSWSPSELKILAEQAIAQGPDRWVALPAQNLLEVLLHLEGQDQKPHKSTYVSGEVAPC